MKHTNATVINGPVEAGCTLAVFARSDAMAEAHGPISDHVVCVDGLVQMTYNDLLDVNASPIARIEGGNWFVLVPEVAGPFSDVSIYTATDDDAQRYAAAPEDEWWVLDAENDQNKIAEAAEATGLNLVGLVAPEGGVVGYVVDDVADQIAEAMNHRLESRRMTAYQIAAYNADTGERIDVFSGYWFTEPESIDGDDIKTAYNEMCALNASITDVERVTMRVERVEAIDHPDARISKVA